MCGIRLIIVIRKGIPLIASNGIVFGVVAGTESKAGAKRQVCKTNSSTGLFKQEKAVLFRIKKGTNNLQVMVTGIKKDRGMDLRGLLLKATG